MKLFWTGLLVVCANVNANDGTEFFEKNVRPVLVRQCLACHSSPTSPMGGLRLDTRESMIKGGTRAPAIVPGKPADSLILRAVRQPETLRMPPAGKLKDAEIAALAEWIAMGAPCGADRGHQVRQCQPEVLGLYSATRAETPRGAEYRVGEISTRPLCPGRAGGEGTHAGAGRG